MTTKVKKENQTSCHSKSSFPTSHHIFTSIQKTCYLLQITFFTCSGIQALFFCYQGDGNHILTAAVKPAVHVTVPVNPDGNDSSLETDTASSGISAVIAACAMLLLKSAEILPHLYWHANSLAAFANQAVFYGSDLITWVRSCHSFRPFPSSVSLHECLSWALSWASSVASQWMRLYCKPN